MGEISLDEPKVEKVNENQGDLKSPIKTKKGACGIALLAWLTDYFYDWDPECYCDWDCC